MIYAKFLDVDGFWRKASFEEGLSIPEKYLILSEEEALLLRKGYVFDSDGNVVPKVIVVTEVMVRQEAATRLEMIASPYQPQERETWYEQIREAEGYLSDPAYPTPFLSKRATARGITVQELATTVIVKRNSYLEATATVLSAQDLLLGMNPIPEDYQNDIYWK